MLMFLFLVSSVLNQVSNNLSSVKSIECNFNEILMFHGDTLNFSGTVYAVRDKARIDVFKPEREIMFFQRDSVFIWRKSTNQVFRRETPMVFYNVLFSPGVSYKVDSTKSGWAHLSPIKSELGYPISVRFNNKFLPERIKFHQESGTGEFTFTSYKLNQVYDEKFFSLNSTIASHQ